VHPSSNRVNTLLPWYWPAYGCRAARVAEVHLRAVAPAREPSADGEPSVARPATPTRDSGDHEASIEPDGSVTAARRVLAQLGPQWRLGTRSTARLEPPVAVALSAGWDHADLASHLGANSEGVKSPYAVLAARLADLPAGDWSVAPEDAGTDIGQALHYASDLPVPPWGPRE